MATAKKAAAKAATKKTAPKAAPKTAASSGSALKPIKETFGYAEQVADLSDPLPNGSLTRGSLAV